MGAFGHLSTYGGKGCKGLPYPLSDQRRPKTTKDTYFFDSFPTHTLWLALFLSLVGINWRYYAIDRHYGGLHVKHHLALANHRSRLEPRSP